MRTRALPSPYLAALLLHRLAAAKPASARRGNETVAASRLRVSATTMKMICGRWDPDEAFLTDVRQHLFRLGWVLFYAGTNYAMVKMGIVERWSRHASKRIEQQLAKVADGDLEALQRELEEELDEPIVLPQRQDKPFEEPQD